MAIIGSFGDIVFEVSTNKILTYHDFSRSTEPRYTEHQVQHLKPRLEYVGQGIDPVKISIRLRSAFGINPEAQMKKIREYAQAGKKDLFIRGGSPISKHKFVIKRVDETHRHVDNKGFALEIEAQLELLEYVEDEISNAKPTTSSTSSTAINKKAIGKIKITVKSVHIRSGPGINNKVLGYAMNGDTLTVLGVENGWYKLGVGRYITANSAYSKFEGANK